MVIRARGSHATRGSGMLTVRRCDCHKDLLVARVADRREVEGATWSRLSATWPRWAWMRVDAAYVQTLKGGYAFFEAQVGNDGPGGATSS